MTDTLRCALMVLGDKGFPWDIRVKREASTLANRYKVYLLTIKRRGEVEEEAVDGLTVLRKLYTNSSYILSYIVNVLLMSFELVRICVKKHISVIHVHDLPYALPVILLGKILRRPVVFDMHEDYVAMLNSGLKEESIGKRIPFFLFLKLLEIEERISLALATKIIVVVEEEIKRLSAMGVPLEKIEVISNTADLEELNNVAVSGSYTKFSNKFLICYVGGFSKHRGLDTLVKALPLFLNEIPNAHLLLVGEGVMKKVLLRLCRDLNVEKNVTFTGWVPFEEAMSYIKASDVCMIPYHKTKQTNKSFPHKLTQYMYFGKPVLVSNVRSLKRIIEETKCGMVFEAGNPNDLAEKVIRIKEQGILQQLGINGRMAVEKKYNWRNTSKRLIALYDQLTTKMVKGLKG